MTNGPAAAVTSSIGEPRRMVVAGESELVAALTVLLGLYPTVMLISLFIMPWLSRLPLAASMLIGNMISVSVLQWILMPPLNRLLASWLKPAALIDRRSNLTGALIAGGTLVCMLVLFVLIGRL
jgi:hypothetical protein